MPHIRSNPFDRHQAPYAGQTLWVRPSRAVRATYGFTLLEVLLAVVLIGILAAIAISMLNAGINTRTIVTERGGEARTLRLALDIMARPLYSALPPTGVLAGEFSGVDDGDLDELTFHAAVDPGGDFGGDIIKITYSIDNESYDNPVLIRETTRNLLASAAPEPEVEILCRNVETLNFSYYDGSQWLDEWESSNNENTLPKAVKMTLTLPNNDDKDEAPTLSRIIPLTCASDAAEENKGVAE